MITASPRLDDLLSFIRKVPRYPISAGEVAHLAENKGEDREVVKFYRSFPEEEIFSDKEDLVTRTESIEVMARDEQPREFYTAPEED